ncbi:MAG: gliding motility-associated C-terminal domain-containing protein, partial [Bacteroidota bacterium]
MSHRIIPLTFFLFCTFFGLAQTPAAVKLEGSATLNLNASFVCPPGANPSAGDADQILFPSAQSNDVRFLCFGDSMTIDNIGPVDLSGDPDPSSAPGVTYAFFDCAPTLLATDLATLVTDPCLTDEPDPSPSAFYAVQDLISPSGDATFFNDGQIQNAFNNGGNPVEVWYAAVTIDDFAAFSYEDDGLGGPVGPCLNVNVADAFSIVYLNEIVASNLNNNAGGNGCTGTMEITGGLPEFDGSNYNITVELDTDPSVTGTFAGATTHGETLKFNVPQPGLYNVRISDDVGCGIVVQMDMGGCIPVTFNIPNLGANPGGNVCLNVTVEDFTDIESFQFTMEWDPAVIQFTNLNGIELSNAHLQSFLVSPGLLTVNWVIFPFPVPTTIADGNAPFEICFDVLGGVGTTSPVEITGNLTPIEIATSGMDNQVGIIINNGGVNVISGNILLDFTSCSSTVDASIGEFTITPNGGTAPYDFQWEEVAMPTNNGMGTIPSEGETVTISPLPPGDYSITVTDNTGDLQVGTVNIADVTRILVQLDRMDPSCATSSDGSVNIAQIIGGVTPFTNVWSNGPVNVDMIDNLPAGSYTVTVTDANGCTSTDDQNIGTLPVVLDTFSLTHVTCPGGGSDGAITVVATGGTLDPSNDYTYIWDTGDSGPSISGLAPNIYCVTATDDNMCSDVMCIEVVAPILPSFVQFDSISLVCPNDTNGELQVTFTEGSAPISNYAWSVPGGVGNTLSGIPAGTYTVTVTADDGCTAVSPPATLFAPPQVMIANTVVDPPMCPGETNGSISITISGGIAPNTVVWDDGSTDQTRPGLTCDTSYVVTITDALGCDQIVESIFFTCPPAITVQIVNEVDVTCFSGGTNNGQATAIASGGPVGSTFYNYSWSSGEVELGVQQSTAVQLQRGMNTVTISDGQCGIIETFFIGSPSQLTIDSIAPAEPSCFGDADGSLTVFAAGGIPPYDYQWVDPLVSGPTIDDIAAGTYTVNITDFNNCLFSVDVDLMQPDPFMLSIDSAQVQSVGCSGDSSGVIVTSATGGNSLLGDISYEWVNDVSNTSVANNLPAGTYSITATDIKGCTDDVQFTLAEPDPIFFEIADIEEPACFGFQTVVTIDTAFGGNGPLYNFSVDFGPRRPISFAIPILGGREHTVTVFDDFGCSVEQTVFVDQPQEVTVNLGDDFEIQLGDSAIIEPVFGLGLAIDSIVWTPEALVTCVDSASCLDVSVMPLETTNYQLTLFDTDGCSGSDDITIEVDRNRNVYIPNVFSPNGDGTNDIFRVAIGPGVERVNFMQVYSRWGELLYNFD